MAVLVNMTRMAITLKYVTGRLVIVQTVVDTDTPDQLLASVTTEMLGKYFDDTAVSGGSVAEWLACWTQAQKGPGSNRRRDAVG